MKKKKKNTHGSRLNRRQQKLISDKLMDTANYTLVSLVFGSITTDIGRLWMAFGLFFYLLCWSYCLYLGKEHYE